MNSEACAVFRDNFHKDLPAILEGHDPHVDTDPAWCSRIDCAQIVRAVSSSSGLSLDIIHGRRRSNLYSCVRRVIYKLIHEQRGDMTVNQIAKFMGRDRTSVSTGIRRAAAFLDFDALTRQIWRDASRALGL